MAQMRLVQANPTYEVNAFDYGEPVTSSYFTPNFQFCNRQEPSLVSRI